MWISCSLLLQYTYRLLSDPLGRLVARNLQQLVVAAPVHSLHRLEPIVHLEDEFHEREVHVEEDAEIRIIGGDEGVSVHVNARISLVLILLIFVGLQKQCVNSYRKFG